MMSSARVPLWRAAPRSTNSPSAATIRASLRKSKSAKTTTTTFSIATGSSSSSSSSLSSSVSHLPQLASLLAELFDAGLSSQLDSSASVVEKCSLIVCPDANTALYLAQVMLQHAPGVASCLLLSVPRAASSSSSASSSSASTAPLSMRLRNLVTAAAVARQMSSLKAPGRVVTTTAEALAAHLAAADPSLDQGLKSTCDLVCLLPGVDGGVIGLCESSFCSNDGARIMQFQSTASSPGSDKSIVAITLGAASADFTPHPELGSVTAPGSEGSLNIVRSFDDDAATLLTCCGDVPGFLARMRYLHETAPGSTIEHTLRACLLGGLWMASSNFPVHVKLAHIFRQLLDRPNQVDEDTGRPLGAESSAHLTLRFQISRAVASVAAALEPLSPQTSTAVAGMVPRSVAKTATTMPPFLFHAICSYAVGVAPNSTLDALCAAWGVAPCGTLTAGSRATKQAARKQGTLVHALRMKYATRLGDAEVSFLEFVMHNLIDTVARLAAVSVGEVRRWMLWDVVFAPQYGQLTPFLQICELLPFRQPSSASATAAAANKGEDDRAQLFVPDKFRTGALATKTLPLAGAAERHLEMLNKAACEEILSAMPSGRVPMFVGDVGNLIGQWHKYNNKYEGRLGLTLTDFLRSHPKHFRVVSNVVMRAVESNTQPVKLRFDLEDRNAAGEGSDDDEVDMFGNKMKQQKRQKGTGQSLSKKHRDQDALMAKAGLRKKHTARSRKKAIRQAQNRLKFNRNVKDMSDSAKVPGYVKAKEKRVKGRGNKMNGRSWKRQL